MNPCINKINMDFEPKKIWTYHPSGSSISRQNFARWDPISPNIDDYSVFAKKKGFNTMQEPIVTYLFYPLLRLPPHWSTPRKGSPSRPPLIAPLALWVGVLWYFLAHA